MDPGIANPSLWDTFNKIFGPGGIPLLLVIGGLCWLVRWMTIRQKEKDAECRQEMAEAEVRWETRFQQMRTDIKEGFSIVAALTQQVTIIGAKGNGTRTP